MTVYRSIDFISARHRAFEHLSQLYNTQRISAPIDSTLDAESWLVELEVLSHGKTLCLNVTIHLGTDFPLSLPRIYLSKEDAIKLGFLPNIDTQGLICTFDPNTNIPNPEAPESLIEICVQQAKKIIEAGINNNNLNKYDQEFIAYWENKYGDEQSVDISILSLIPDRGKLPSTIKCAQINPPIGYFHALIYSEPQQLNEFQGYLRSHKISWNEVPTFYLGKLDVWSPPYNLSNRDALSLITKAGLENEFITYLSSRPSVPIVTFTRIIDERVLVFGWCHKRVENKIRHRGRNMILREVPFPPGEYRKLLKPENASILVNRISPQVYNPQRLVQRSAADYDLYENKNTKSVLLAGLGSIGSNLVPFLEKSGISEYRLVDEDLLLLDNLGRHFLGINDIGRFKTEALRDYLQRKDPFIRVHTREKRIIPLVHNEPKFLSECDYYFLCTGDVNSEMWLAQNIHQSEWDRPTFFIWVEPYLAGGHCVYYNGVDQIAWQDLFPHNKFVYNIISEDVHNQVTFTKREAGCQITYIPYSAANLQLFIAAVFPKILNLLKTKGQNKSFSWIGDLAVLEKLKIKLSPHGVNTQSFSLVERSI